MKKRMFCLLAAVLAVLMSVAALAEGQFDYSKMTTPNYIVVDAGDTDAANPIAEKGADDKVFPASTTKILTSIVALENCDLDKEITVGSEILGLYELKKGYTPQSSLMGLVQGETVTLNDLLHGLMLVSGNEAADAIAVGVAGSIENFVKMMNDKAAELGMTKSHFMNPNGVNHDNHYSTPRDMAKLTAYALKNPRFVALWSTPNYVVPANSVRGNDLVLVNTNLLLTAEASPQYASLPYEYCIGGKTGLTTKAGSCLVTAAEKEGARAIICLYGDKIDGDAKYERFRNAKAIFEDIFNNVYTSLSGDELNLQKEFTVKIENGVADYLDENGCITLTADVSGFNIRALPAEVDALRNDPAGIKAELDCDTSLSAPMYQGQLIGTVTYTHNGKAIYSTDLTAPHDVPEIALVASQVVGADGTDGTASGLLSTPEPVTAAEPRAKTGLSTPVKIIIVAVAVLLIALIVLIIIGKIKKAQRKKRRAEAMRRRREEQQQQPALRTRTRAAAPREPVERGASATPGATRKVASTRPVTRTQGAAPKAADPARRTAPRVPVRKNPNAPVAGMPKRKAPKE